MTAPSVEKIIQLLESEDSQNTLLGAQLMEGMNLKQSVFQQWLKDKYFRLEWAPQDSLRAKGRLSNHKVKCMSRLLGASLIQQNISDRDNRLQIVFLGLVGQVCFMQKNLKTRHLPAEVFLSYHDRSFHLVTSDIRLPSEARKLSEELMYINQIEDFKQVKRTPGYGNMLRTVLLRVGSKSQTKIAFSEESIGNQQVCFCMEVKMEV